MGHDVHAPVALGGAFFANLLPVRVEGPQVELPVRGALALLEGDAPILVEAATYVRLSVSVVILLEARGPAVLVDLDAIDLAVLVPVELDSLGDA
ncbi:MAG: hypothetical protein JRH10_10930 [Deltaproteobacteria bacterium]|nr:hypothetical protein [Deltaproteobacteria bacterium]